MDYVDRDPLNETADGEIRQPLLRPMAQNSLKRPEASPQLQEAVSPAMAVSPEPPVYTPNEPDTEDDGYTARPRRSRLVEREAAPPPVTPGYGQPPVGSAAVCFSGQPTVNGQPVYIIQQPVCPFYYQQEDHPGYGPVYAMEYQPCGGAPMAAPGYCPGQGAAAPAGYAPPFCPPPAPKAGGDPLDSQSEPPAAPPKPPAEGDEDGDAVPSAMMATPVPVSTVEYPQTKKAKKWPAVLAIILCLLLGGAVYGWKSGLYQTLPLPETVKNWIAALPSGQAPNANGDAASHGAAAVSAPAGEANAALSESHGPQATGAAQTTGVAGGQTASAADQGSAPTVQPTAAPTLTASVPAANAQGANAANGQAAATAVSQPVGAAPPSTGTAISPTASPMAQTTAISASAAAPSGAAASSPREANAAQPTAAAANRPAALDFSFAADRPAAPARLTFTIRGNALATDALMINEEGEMLTGETTESADGAGKRWITIVDYPQPYQGEVRLFLSDESGSWVDTGLTLTVQVQ